MDGAFILKNPTTIPWTPAARWNSAIRWNPADSFLLLTALLWGINIPVVKFATQHMDAMTFNALRMILSTLTLGICWRCEVWMSRRRSAPASENGSQAGLNSQAATHKIGIQASEVTKPRFMGGRILGFALLSGLLYPLAFMEGIDRTTAGNTALLLASMPMWTALLSKLVYAERLSRLTWIGLLVTFVGTLLIIQARGGVDLSREHLVGNCFMLAGAMTWASATVVSMPLLKWISPLQLAFFSALFTTPIHVGLHFESILDWLPRLGEPSLLSSVLYSGVLSTGVAYATWNIGVRKLGGSHAAVYQNLVTIVAVLISWFVLGEPVLVLQVVGGVVAIGGLVLIRRGRA